MWHITKRELYDNLNSLRFALTTVLLLALMVTNAVRHIREHPKRVQKYRDAVAESLNQLTSHADISLYRLAQKGPGPLYKKPSPLHFCAEGGETFLPDRVGGSYYYTEKILETKISRCQHKYDELLDPMSPKSIGHSSSVMS